MWAPDASDDDRPGYDRLPESLPMKRVEGAGLAHRATRLIGGGRRLEGEEERAERGNHCAFENGRHPPGRSYPSASA